MDGIRAMTELGHHTLLIYYVYKVGMNFEERAIRPYKYTSSRLKISVTYQTSCFGALVN